MNQKQKNQLMIAIVMGAIGYATYQFYDFYTTEVPQMEQERQGQEQKIRTQQAELKRLQEFARNIQSIKSEFRELNFQLESALEHMPRAFNLPVLLRRLNMLAQNSGVELLSFKPSKEDERQQDAFYSTVGIEVALRGTFTQTLVFLDQVSRLKRIVNVEKIIFRPVSESAQMRSGALVTESSLTLKTYRFSE